MTAATAPAAAATEATYPVTVAASHLTQEWKDRRSLTWAALCHRLTDHRVGAKAGPCFTPATFRGTSRLKSDAEVIGLAVLDLDDGSRSLAEIKAAVGRRGWAGVIYSTHSHAPGHPKFRLVIPLARPWRASDHQTQDAANTAWRERYFALAAALNVAADSSCTDTSRLFYLPRHAEGAPFETAVVEGATCDIWSLPAAPTDQPAPANDKPASRPESGQIDGARLRYAAAAFDAEVAAVRQAREGTRNQTLNNAALSLGTLVGAGLLAESLIRSALTAAALDAGLAVPEIEATLNSGLRAGIAQPRQIPEPTRRPSRPESWEPPPRGECDYDPETGEIHEPTAEPAPGDSSPPPQRHADRAPIPLGYDHGVYYYLSQETGQVEAIAAERHTEAMLCHLASAEHYWKHTRHLNQKTGVDWKAAADSLRTACKSVGIYDPGAPRCNSGAAADSLDDLVNPVDLVGIEPPDRGWIVTDWLPVGTVTSLYGGAGFGKTLVAEQLQIATALGRPFLGLETTQCRSLAFFCEDDADELHRRARAVCRLYGASMADLGAARWQGRFGKRNVMATISEGVLSLTEFYAFVRRAALETGARLLIIDNIAQVFAGNENIRPEVTQFVNSLGTIALEINGAVLLLGHPGKAVDSQFSGSTAWDATVRCRWVLERVKPDAEQEASELADLRVLKKPKANYAGTGDEIVLRWDRGAFVVEGAPALKDAVDRIEAKSEERADESRFLACLDALAAQNRAVSDSKNAATFAAKLMPAQPQWKGVPKARTRIVAAMNRLFDAGAIIAHVEVGRKSNRNRLFGIGRAEGAPGSKEVRPGAPQSVAPECTAVTGNPLESLHRSAPHSVSPITPMSAVAPIGAPPSDDDFAALAEEGL